MEIDNLLTTDDIRVLVEVCEAAGTMRSAELAEIVETHELDALEQEALLRELEARGIEIVEDTAPTHEVAEPERERDADRRRSRRPTRSSCSCARPDGMNC